MHVPGARWKKTLRRVLVLWTGCQWIQQAVQNLAHIHVARPAAAASTVAAFIRLAMIRIMLRRLTSPTARP